MSEEGEITGRLRLLERNSAVAESRFEGLDRQREVDLRQLENFKSDVWAVIGTLTSKVDNLKESISERIEMKLEQLAERLEKKMEERREDNKVLHAELEKKDAAQDKEITQLRTELGALKLKIAFIAGFIAMIQIFAPYIIARILPP